MDDEMGGCVPPAWRELAWKRAEQATEQARRVEAGSPYCGDDYERRGCRLVIDVTEWGYALSVFGRLGVRMETYASAKTPAAIGRMVEEWCAGKRPRPQHCPGQPPEGEA